MWRLRLFFERLNFKRLGWKRLLIVVAAVVVALVAAGMAFAFLRGGDDSATATTQAPEETTNLFYLRAVAPRVQVSGCTMYIKFTWKPDYHADQYIGYPALIQTTGTGISGTHRLPFKANGLSLQVGPVELRGYSVWQAKVLSIDGDPPGNDTTVQAAPPQASATNCG